MKTQFRTCFLAITMATLSALTFVSCLDDECSEQQFFIEYQPIYMTAAQFRQEPVFENAQEMINTGKIYFYQDYIFINERYEGIHIIDNANPESPQNIGFIRIPGNVDVAARGTYLYADNYTDLLTIDISDFTNPGLVCREENAFNHYSFDASQGYLVRMESTERRIAVDCNDPNYGDISFNRNGGIFWLEDALTGGLDGPGVIQNTQGNETGTGGSLARFTIAHDFLYTINDQELTAFDLGENTCPDRTVSTYVSWGIETLFPYKEYLFIGSRNGMYIYDATIPATPQYLSQFNHANACDPVFVKDDIAYVTLRDGTLCEDFVNQLDVIDVSNVLSPRLIVTHEMDHPHGLSVRDNTLYLCEGEYGLKVFDVSDAESIPDNRLDHIKNMHAYDVISLSSQHLLVIGEDGLYQYDTSKPSDLKLMSFLAVEK